MGEIFYKPQHTIKSVFENLSKHQYFMLFTINFTLVLLNKFLLTKLLN
nr:MAG TPA: hypothetical protein [Ackermannviridae sp.]DAW82307.1 MAG TPA: hypothetical protein [Bacteriophage sp.]